MIVRKDLPLKSFITTFETKIDDKKMNEDLIKVIDKYGDRQNHKTNVKAQMTEWKMWKEPGFDKLSKIAMDMAHQASVQKYNRPVNLIMTNLWGMKYKSNEVAVAHDHWPSLWSFAYYINAPKGAPGLFFPEMGEQGGERPLETGLLVMFEGTVKHGVRPAKFRGSRYVVSGNMNEDTRAYENS